MENGKKKPVQRPFLRAKDTPRPALAILYGIQQIMVCASALLTVPIITATHICPGADITRLRNELISSTFVSSGISTIIQTLFGMRLALLQGTAFAYVPSVQVYMEHTYGCTANESTFVHPDEYHAKVALLQGCLMASSIVPILIGATGLVGLLTKFIGPLTVSTLMLLLAFSQVGLMVSHIAKHWVAIVQAVTLFATILYLADIQVPLPGIKRRKFHWYKSNVFGQYPYLIAILISWLFCVLLTVFNFVAEDSPARVDKNISIAVIKDSSWFELPYPGKFGPPTFNMALFLAFLLSAMTSVFESVGDYHAAARVSQERAPPSHAINRGIMSEGLGSLVSGLLGPGVGMTTHTENIGVIGVTRVASRWTMVIAGFLLILLGLCTKIGAILSTIPDPLVGGVLASSMAMVVGVAVSNLQSVDMNLSRNMGIFGFSMMFGMIVPEYFRLNPVNTGIEFLDTILRVLLTLQMFIGAMCACILDNTVGGATREQRGLRERGEMYDGHFHDDVYSYPKFVMRIFDKIPCIRYIPFMPKEKRSSSNKVQDVDLENVRM